MGINKDLIAASSTPLVLAILAERDSYGYAILQRVRELSGGRMEWTDGMLYPVLHRLERRGFIRSRWGTSENGRRRKYYRLTGRGAQELAGKIVVGKLAEHDQPEFCGELQALNAERETVLRAELRRDASGGQSGRVGASP